MTAVDETPAIERGVVIDGVEHLSLTIEQAVRVTGLSRDSLEQARDRNELPWRYPNRKPLILPADLRKWLAALGTEPRGPRATSTAR